MGIEFRWADGDYTRHEELVADLVRQKVDVIVATSAPTAVAAKKVPRGAIPLVFTSGEDPVKDGLVSSLNRPGGDTTDRKSTRLNSSQAEDIRDLYVTGVQTCALPISHV